MYRRAVDFDGDTSLRLAIVPVSVCIPGSAIALPATDRPTTTLRSH